MVTYVGYRTWHLKKPGADKTWCEQTYGARAKVQDALPNSRHICVECTHAAATQDTTPAPPPQTSPAVPDLAAAIAAAAPGDTIECRGKSYTGPITINKSLTLLGPTVVGRVFPKSSDITIYVPHFTGSTAGAQQGTLDMPSGFDRLHIFGGYIGDGDGTGIKLRGGADHVIDGLEIARMLQLGYGFGNTQRLVMRRSLIRECNYTDKYSPGWEAGGGKMVHSYDALFEDNESRDNHGPGFWDDIGDHRTTFRRNHAHHNQGVGIFAEISFDELIEQNVVNDNMAGAPAFAQSQWVWPSGIRVSTNTGAVVRDNIVVRQPVGIGVAEQDRTASGLSLYPARGIRIEGNSIVGDVCLIGFAQDAGGASAGGDLFDPANGNGSANNRLWLPSGEPSSSRFAWGGSWYKTLADWQAAGADVGSSYMTTAEKDQLLALYGL